MCPITPLTDVPKVKAVEKKKVTLSYSIIATVFLSHLPHPILQVPVAVAVPFVPPPKYKGADVPKLTNEEQLGNLCACYP